MNARNSPYIIGKTKSKDNSQYAHQYFVGRFQKFKPLSFYLCGNTFYHQRRNGHPTNITHTLTTKIKVRWKGAYSATFCVVDVSFFVPIYTRPRTHQS